MTRRLTWSVGGAVLICTFVGQAHANGFRNPPEGAAALGRTGGKIVHVDGPTAVAHNPANTAGQLHSSVEVGVGFVDSDVDFTGLDGRKDSTDNDVSIIPNVFATTPIGGKTPLTLGIGLSSPWGQSTEWPETGAFLGVAPHHAELTTINVNPTVAARVHDRVTLGAGVDLLKAELDIRQLIPLAPGVPLTGLRLNSDGYGVGGNAGMTVALTDKQKVALTYRTAVDVDLEGDTDFSGFTGPLAPNSDFDTEIEFPAMAVAGYGVELPGNVRVEVDVEWIEFSSYDQLPLDLGVNSAAGLFPPAIPQNWDDVWTYGLGADWKFHPNWTARAGWVYLESPIPEETLAPTLPDGDRNVFSLGLGYSRSAHKVDVAYAYSAYDRKVDTNVNPAYLGEYEAEVHLLQASYACSF